MELDQYRDRAQRDVNRVYMLQSMVRRILGRGAENYVMFSDMYAPHAKGWGFAAPFMYKGMYFYVHPLHPDLLMFCVASSSLLHRERAVYHREIISRSELETLIGQGTHFMVSPKWSTFRTFERLLKELASPWSRWRNPAPATVDDHGIVWGNRRWRVIEGVLEVEQPDGSFMWIPDRATMHRVLAAS